MPIYEYACSACSHQFEEWQKMSDPPVRTCPKCKKKKVERLISATAFQLKGGGWYADLYSSSKPGQGSSGDSGKSSTSESSKSSKSESKAESKSDSGKAKGSKDTAKKAETRAV